MTRPATATAGAGDTAVPTGSRASRGLIRTRLLQARVRAESDWADWSDATAARLIDLPALARLRELYAHQADLTPTAWYRVAESLLPQDDRSLVPGSKPAEPAAPAEPVFESRGLPWDRRSRNRARPCAAPWAEATGIRPARPGPLEQPAGPPAHPPARLAFPDRSRGAAPPPRHGIEVASPPHGGPARAAAKTGLSPAQPQDPNRPAPPSPPDQADTPDLLLGVLVLAGLLLGVYWLFSERVL